MRNDFGTNYLMHHGILGMKWGVRNGPPYPLDSSDKTTQELALSRKKKIVLTDNQKKIFKAIAITAGAVGIGAAAYYCLRGNSAFLISKAIPRMGNSGPKIISEAKDIIKKELKDTDIVLNKGTELYKANVGKNFDISKVDDVIYSSYDKLDRIAYRYGLRNWRNNKERYEAVFKVSDDMFGPSKEEAKRIFDQVFNSNEEYKNKLVESLANQYVRAFNANGLNNVLSEDQVYDKALRYAEEAIVKSSFQSGMSNLVSNSKTSKILVDAFRKEGYDFVEDYMDKGTMARNPVVILNNDKLIQTGVKWYNYYNLANRRLAKNILIKNKHGGAFGWSVDNP